MVLEKLNMHIKKRKKETGPLPHTTHKNQLKVDSRLKPKTWNKLLQTIPWALVPQGP